MVDRCTIQGQDVCWDQPVSPVSCDPCVDLTNTQDLADYQAAWQLAVSYVYRNTGCQWPGACWRERVRPCVDRCWWDSYCRSLGCGSYMRLPLAEADFCLPVQELIGINIVGGDCCPCNETGILTPENNLARLEWVVNQPVVVLQRPSGDDGCCPKWWPQQDLCRPDEDECTWSIDVRTGCDPPPEVVEATAALAVAMVAECKNTGCTLAQGATRVTTRGATFDIDRDQLYSGFWWSMLSEIIANEKDHIVETFGFLGDGRISWHHVDKPTRIV